MINFSEKGGSGYPFLTSASEKKGSSHAMDGWPPEVRMTSGPSTVPHVQAAGCRLQSAVCSVHTVGYCRSATLRAER